ncbi:MAG: phage tail spike protein, partial [Gordonibacter sp.]|uniref:phage tail spike protein n=1 Tax=Gordonibacter sp. TaxID=1968902 RepID=UPI002FCA073F
VAVSGTRVTSRRVSLLKHVGTDEGRRFTYRKNLSGCTRTVSDDDVCTALYGWGASLEASDEDGNLTGGYSRKLSFADANGGVKWTGDDAAREKWGRPDGKGGKAHVFGDASFDECEDPAELLRLTKAELPARSQPKVSYSASVAATRNAGAGLEGSDEGDAVAVIDDDLGVRVMSRITKVVEDQLEEENTEYEFGNFGDLADVFKTQKSSIRDSADSVASYAQNAVNASNAQTNKNMGALGDKFAQEVSEAIKHGDDQAAALKAEMDKIPSDIRDQLIDMINEEVNTTGGWVYEEPGKGIFVYDARPENATKCVKIGGGIVAVANSKYSNGSWYFKTAMNGDGIVADRIYTGRITGGSSYFDLDSGTINMRNGIINITDANGNTVTVSPSLGFQVRDKNGSMIAGTVLIEGKPMFVAGAIGHQDSYATLGTTVTGYGGLAYVQNGVSALEVTPVADKNGRSGIDMSAGGNHFIGSFARCQHGKATVLVPPSSGFVHDYIFDPVALIVSSQGIYAKANGVINKLA